MEKADTQPNPGWGELCYSCLNQTDSQGETQCSACSWGWAGWPDLERWEDDTETCDRFDSGAPEGAFVVYGSRIVRRPQSQSVE